VVPCLAVRSCTRHDAAHDPASVRQAGKHRKYRGFWTYCVQDFENTDADGFKIPFAAGHTRRMPRLTAGPLRYKVHADSYLDVALRYSHVPVKQTVDAVPIEDGNG
jgi:hypothetical protein